MLLFHNIFNMYFYLKKSNYMFICEIWLFNWHFPQFHVEVWISRSVSEGPLDFEIIRVSVSGRMDVIYVRI